VSDCADDRRLSMWLHENRNVGGIRRERRHGHVEAPDLTLPRAQGTNATHNIELFCVFTGEQDMQAPCSMPCKQS